MKNFVCISLLLLLNYPLMGGWLERKAEGWAWYEDKEKKIEEEEPILIIPPIIIPQPSPLEELDNIKKGYDEKLAKAVMNPTDENVADLMREQKKWMDQSQHFSKVWSRVLLQQPELDETANGFPVSQYGIQAKKQIVQENKEALIKTLAKDRGLFFFYEGKNKISIVFSMVVKEFALKYDWNVFAISVDEVSIDGFSNNKKDNGITQNLGITIFPSLFIVNPLTNEVEPISFGLNSIDQIENNIMIQFEDKMESLK